MHKIISRSLRLLVLTALVCAATLRAPAQTATGYLYASDYGNLEIDNGTENVLRYSFTYNTTTGAITTGFSDAPGVGMVGANFLTGFEGITGTSDSILTATQNGVYRYNSQGGLLGQINVTYNGNAHTFNGIAGMATDGTYLYVAEETGGIGNATGSGVVDKINLKTGAITAQYSFNGAHDVALAPDGTLYVAGYSSTNGIQVLDPTTMAMKTTILTNNANGNTTISRPTGMSFTGTATSYTLYAQSNSATQNSDSVGILKITNSTGTTSGTVARNGNAGFHTPTTNPLTFTFGNAIGPNGELYIANLGDGSGTSYPNVQDGIYEFNTGSFASTDAIAGYKQGAGSITVPVNSSPNSGNLVAPKYIVFNTDFTPNGDTGVPEPGVTAAACAIITAGISVRKRRSQKRRLRAL